jgi:hypothetical protein
MTKQEQLTNAIKTFMNDQKPETMFDMIVAVVSVTKQGSGLMWPDIKEIVDKCYGVNSQGDFINCSKCGTRTYKGNTISGMCISCSGEHNPKI